MAALIAGVVVYPMFDRRLSPHRLYEICSSNVKVLSYAIDIYAEENGRLPETLAAIEKSHLKAIPSCPAVGRATYAYTHVSTRFTVYCDGSQHSDYGLPRDYPQYTERGPVEVP